MIQYLEHPSVDKAKWDLCIEQSINSMIYANSWFLDSVSPGWDALVLGDYEAVMPLTHSKKYFFHYLHQPFFTQQLGVFFKVEPSQDLLKSFVDAIPKKFKYVDIQLNEQNQLLDEQFTIRKRKNYLLDLNKPYEKLQKGFNEQAKRNLKKAKKVELQLKTVSFEDAIAFYKLHKADITKGVTDAHYERLEHLMAEAHQRKKLITRAVYTKTNEMVASGLFLAYKSRIIFLLGTGSETGREFGAMHYLIDNLIFQFANHKLTFDFEGSDIPGIARFFKSFGSERFHYYRLVMNRLPWLVQLFKH